MVNTFAAGASENFRSVGGASGNHRVRAINLSTGIITTVAGNGSGGYSGDGVAANIANINNPTGVAVDAQNNLYIADRNNQRIRKVDAATKLISTIAGEGMQGFGGDGGPATAAQLNNPNDVTVDGAGNVYFTDQSNNRIRRVKTDGKIETIAGNGSAGYSGEGGAALQAQLNSPASIAIDSDCSLYVGDNGSLRVRKLDRPRRPLARRRSSACRDRRRQRQRDVYVGQRACVRDDR
jgi:sugar lactone lactonase YvrE